jgi:hypothetical protein
MATLKPPPEVRAYLSKIGATGGKHSSGAIGRSVWADVPAEARSKRMRELVRKRRRNGDRGEIVRVYVNSCYGSSLASLQQKWPGESARGASS